MENKKKIWAAVAAIVIIVVLALVFVLGGKDNTTVADTDVVETITTEVVTVEGTESNGESAVVDNIDYLAGVTEAPEDNSGDEVIENETIKDFVDETDNKVEDTKDETSTSESGEDVSVIEPGVVEEPINGNEGNGDTNVEPNLGGDNGNGGNETTPVETPPAVEPEPTTPVTPPSSGNGDNLSFSGSTTLPSGLTISTLNEFNNAGMDTSFDNSWFGDVNSDVAAQNYGTMIDNFDNFNGVWSNSAINVTSNARIEWRNSLADSTGAIELRKSSDYEQYNIIIRGPYLDLATAESMGWSLGNSGDAPAKEALVTLLSAITPNCVEVKDAIVASLYTAPNGQEPISIDGSWATIGDCQVRLNSWDTDNGNYIFVFNIRGK